MKTQGWKKTTLGSACNIYQPETIPKKLLSSDGPYPVYGANGKIGYYHKYNHKYSQLLITCRGATCGSINVSEPKSWVTGNAMVVSPKDVCLDLKYLEYFLRGMDFSSIITGAAQPQITRKSLSPVEVLKPPLEEQKRIVAILDQAFAALDRAQANAEANLADAKELKKRAIESALSSPDLGSFEIVAPHVELLTGFAFKSSGYTESTDSIALVRGDNIIQGGFRWENVKRWPISARKNYEKYKLALNDVLIAMDRTWVSAGIKYAVVDEEALPSLLVQRVARLRTKESLEPRYLAYWIGSTFFEKYVLSIQTGLGVPHVSGQQLNNFSIRVPDVQKQVEIANRLDSVTKQCDRLAEYYKKTAQDITDLRQSLLQKAFAGELT